MPMLLALLLLLAPAGELATGETSGMPTIEEVTERHTNRLMQLPGVVSVGIGRDPDGRTAIVIGLDGQRPETKAALPAELEGYPLCVRILGVPRAQ